MPQTKMNYRVIFGVLIVALAVQAAPDDNFLPLVS